MSSIEPKIAVAAKIPGEDKSALTFNCAGRTKNPVIVKLLQFPFRFLTLRLRLDCASIPVNLMPDVYGLMDGVRDSPVRESTSGDSMPRRSHLRITKRTVDGLRVSEKDAVFWDRDIAGLGVRVHATGRKIYVVQSRGGAGLKCISLGRHGELSPEDARKRVAAVIDRIKRGEALEAAPVVTVPVADLAGFVDDRTFSLANNGTRYDAREERARLDS